jgi:signal transduction histidine kinase
VQAARGPSRVLPLASLPARVGAASPRLRLLLAGARPGARDAVGALVFCWIVAITIASLRLAAEDPDWGIELAPAPGGGGAVAAAVRGHAVGWRQGIRPGDRIVLVEDRDAGAFVGRALGGAHRLAVATGAERPWVATAPALPRPLLLTLLLASVLFAILGVAIHRWASDPRVGAIFLVFSASSATALAAIPGALMGSGLAYFLAASGATVAAAAFPAVFLWFPRPLRLAVPATWLLAATTTGLLAPIALALARGAAMSALLDGLLFAWLASSLIAAAALLVGRATRSADRHALAPIAVGVGLGAAPVALLSALPQAVGRAPILPIELAAVSASAIPLAFGYAILRYRLFALDAQLRGLLVRVCGGAAILAAFVVGWLALRRVGVDDELAVVIAAAVAALAAPAISAQVERALDAFLYPQLYQARTLTPTDRPAALASIATTVAVRVRELVPVRWVACFVPTGGSPADPPLWRLVGADGDVPPALLGDLASDAAIHAASSNQAVVLPVERPRQRFGLIVVGPRLDGAPLGGVDVQTIWLLTRSAAAPLEAALLREQAAGEESFRDGLSLLARDLAAAEAVEDVLRLTAEHATALLAGERASVWFHDRPDGAVEMLPCRVCDGAAPAEPPRDLASPLDDDLASRVRRERLLRWVAGDGARIAFALGEPGLVEAVALVARDPGRPAFGAEDERRARQIVDHADGALRRARMSAQAAEVEALRELDQMKNALMDMLAHDLQNPLTAIGAYAQRLQLGADRIPPTRVAELGGRLVDLARRSQGLVRDLLTSTGHERGRLALLLESVDVGELLGRLAAGYELLPGGDRLSVDAPAAVCALADPARLDQIVANLLQNALRYAPEGPIVLRARAAASDEVWIEVSDQGPGIPLAEQAHVWEKFYRTASGGRVTRAGSGIGLWVVRTLAELHGGRAELESEPGRGSTFRIVLPRAPEPPAADRS